MKRTRRKGGDEEKEEGMGNEEIKRNRGDKLERGRDMGEQVETMDSEE